MSQNLSVDELWEVQTNTVDKKLNSSQEKKMVDFKHIPPTQIKLSLHDHNESEEKGLLEKV